MAYFTKEELERFRSQALTSTPQQQQQQLQQAPQKKKGFWQDQISTGGGIGGALAGAAAGGAIGAGAAGVGAIPGALIGAVLGGFGGGAGGQAVENAVVGDELGKDVLKEGAMNALFSVGPIRGVNVAYQGGRALLGGAGKAGIREAVERGATSTPIRTALSNAAGKASDDLAVKGLRLTPSQLANFKEKFGVDVSQTIKSNNLIGRNADEIDVARQALDDQFSNIVTNAPAVSKAAIMKQVDDVAAKLSKAGPSDSKQVAQALKAEADTALAGFGDEVPATALNQLRRNFDSLVNYTEKAANPNRYNVNKRMADVLRGTLQQSADNAGLNANGRSLKELGMEISKLRQLNKVAGKQENLGRGVGAVGLRDMIAGGSLGGGGLLAGGPLGGALGAATGIGLSKVANSPTTARMASQGLESLAGRVAAGGGAPTALGTAARMGAAGAGGSLFNALGGAPDMENEQQQVAGLDQLGAMTDPTMVQQPQQPTNSFGVSPDQLKQAMFMALANNDSDAFKQLQQMYELVQEEDQQFNSTTAASLAMSDNGLNTLNQLEQLYTGAGGGSGKIGGAFKSSMGNLGLNDTVASYEALAASSVSQLAKAINGGGQVSDADAAVIIQALPKINDSPQVAATKFRALKERLAAARQNTMLYNSGASASPQEPAF